MNKLEAIVYNIVKGSPTLKQFVRNIYQSIFDLLPRKNEFFVGEVDYKEDYFFGFHDLNPLSGDCRRLLAMHPSFDLRMPKSKDALEIGYFDFLDGKLGNFNRITFSYAWNFHKGCRLQWLKNNSIIFNTAYNGMLCSKIINILTNEEILVNFPIDSVFQDENISIASSFSYERLERCMPGYGYPYKDDGYLDISAPETTGLYVIDLKNNKRKMLVSLRALTKIVFGQIDDNRLYFVTHTEFAPDGKYLAFLFRSIPKVGDYMKRKTMLCVYSFEKKQVIVLPSQESGSHYVWNNNHQILASCFMDNQNCHVLFDVDKLENYQKICPTFLNSDGHQSFVSDYCFITDTYPDKYRMSKLYLSDIKKNELVLLASVYSPKTFQTKDFHCHIACDLHPRVISNGKFVCFDSPRTGKRGLYVMKINSD